MNFPNGHGICLKKIMCAVLLWSGMHEFINYIMQQKSRKLVFVKKITIDWEEVKKQGLPPTPSDMVVAMDFYQLIDDCMDFPDTSHKLSWHISGIHMHDSNYRCV